MNCKRIKLKIDHFLIEKKGTLTKAASQHIAECPDCREHYESALLFSKLTLKLKEKEPPIKYPKQLTQSIMHGISQKREIKVIKKSGALINSFHIQRLLAAASICLMITFGIEQFRVLAKLNKLELTNQSIGLDYQNKNANHNGSLEGFILLKVKSQIKKHDKLFENLRLEQYNNQEIFGAYNQVKQGTFSNKQLSQFLGNNFRNVRADYLIEAIKYYNKEDNKSKQINKY